MRQPRQTSTIAVVALAACATTRVPLADYWTPDWRRFEPCNQLAIRTGKSGDVTLEHDWDHSGVTFRVAESTVNDREIEQCVRDVERQHLESLHLRPNALGRLKTSYWTLHLPESHSPDGLSRDEIGPVIDSHQEEIQLCYWVGLRTDRILGGRVEMHWVVGPDGGVTHVGVASSTLDDWRVADCMTYVIKRFRFPAPHGGGEVNVTYPWDFVPPR